MIIFKGGSNMKSIRKGVFETNSSSTHSLTIEKNYGNDKDLYLKLPNNKGYELGYFDILKYPLPQEGYSNSEVEKLRIVVSLISEFIYYEIIEKIEAEWRLKNPNARYGWTREYQEFIDKKSKLKGTHDYALNHRFWKYLNALLKKRLNINIKVYERFNWIPFISERVDVDLGCESSKYYKELGLSSKMTRDEFINIVEKVIFDSDVYIFQETFRDDGC